MVTEADARAAVELARFECDRYLFTAAQVVRVTGHFAPSWIVYLCPRGHGVTPRVHDRLCVVCAADGEEVACDPVDIRQSAAARMLDEFHEHPNALSAMDKMRAGLRRPDGKIVKPPGFVPPDMSEAVAA